DAGTVVAPGRVGPQGDVHQGGVTGGGVGDPAAAPEVGDGLAAGSRVPADVVGDVADERTVPEQQPAVVVDPGAVVVLRHARLADPAVADRHAVDRDVRRR